MTSKEELAYQLRTCHLAVCDKISIELLEAMGVGESATQEALQSLKANGIAIWGNLLDLKNEEEAANEAAGGNAIVGARIWSTVQEYKKRLASFSAPTLSLLPKVSVEDEDALTKFLVGQLENEIRTMELKDRLFANEVLDRNLVVFKLVLPLPCRSGVLRDKIYLREDVRTAVRACVAWLTDEENHGYVLILGGSRGIGKSVIGSLIAIYLAANGYLVAYRTADGFFVMFTGKLPPGILRKFNKLLEGCGFSPVPSNGGVYRLKTGPAQSTSVYDELYRMKDAIWIEDIDETDDFVRSAPSAARRLIVTSPNAQKLDKITRIPSVWWLILPTWTKEDILALGSNVVSNETLVERFERFGGLPRWVNEAEEGESEHKQDEQISSITGRVLGRLACLTGFESIMPMGERGSNTDLILRIEPTEGNWPNPTFDCGIKMLCSDYAQLKILDSLVDSEGFDDLRRFIFLVWDKTCFASIRSRLIVAYFHKAMVSGEVKTDLCSWGNCSTSTTSTSSVFKFGRMTRDTRDLDKFEIGTYYYTSFAGPKWDIDSFAIVDCKVAEQWLPDHLSLKEKDIKLFLFCFKIMTGPIESNLVNEERIRTWQSIACKYFKIKSEEKLPVVLVFVVRDPILGDHLLLENSHRKKETASQKKKRRKTMKPKDNQSEIYFFQLLMKGELREVFEHIEDASTDDEE